MKPLIIRFFHGEPHDIEKSFFLQKVTKLCRKSPDGNYFYDGNLVEWANAWRDRFLYYPPDEKDNQFIQGTIFVTQYFGWGSR